MTYFKYLKLINNRIIMKKKYIATTLKIEDGTKKTLKLLAVQNNINLQDLVNSILNKAIVDMEATANK